MNAALAVRGLVKRYPALTALQGVDLEVQEGEFFGLLGPNGAGKTTLISILAGLTRASAGRAAVMGYDVQSQYREARRRLGVVPQELVYDPFFTVRETLRIQSGYFGLKHNDDWLNEVMHHLDLLPHAEKNMRALSGGMKRRVLVAQALVHKPPVIILDEPTAGVDVSLRQALWKFVQSLNRQGHTIVLTTHYLEEAEALCGRIAMLKNGRIVALDSTRNLLARADERCATLNLRGDVAAAGIAGLTGHGEGVWRFRFERYEELEALLARLREERVTVEDLQLARADLEDVFNRIIATP